MWQAPFACLLFSEGIFPVGDFLCILNIFLNVSDAVLLL